MVYVTSRNGFTVIIIIIIIIYKRKRMYGETLGKNGIPTLNLYNIYYIHNNIIYVVADSFIIITTSFPRPAPAVKNTLRAPSAGPK